MDFMRVLFLPGGQAVLAHIYGGMCNTHVCCSMYTVLERQIDVESGRFYDVHKQQSNRISCSFCNWVLRWFIVGKQVGTCIFL